MSQGTKSTIQCYTTFSHAHAQVCGVSVGGFGRPPSPLDLVSMMGQRERAIRLRAEASLVLLKFGSGEIYMLYPMVDWCL